MANQTKGAIAALLSLAVEVSDGDIDDPAQAYANLQTIVVEFEHVFRKIKARSRKHLIEKLDAAGIEHSDDDKNRDLFRRLKGRE